MSLDTCESCVILQNGVLAEYLASIHYMLLQLGLVILFLCIDTLVAALTLERL